MKIAVVSSSPIIENSGMYYAYTPYANELEIWAKNAGEISFMCPVWHSDRGLLVSNLSFSVSRIFEAKEFNVKSFANAIRAIQYSFFNFYQVFRAMRDADHIHLRCPGNIGLMGCLVQIYFRRKPKTAKYAGNWDPKAAQPFSYKLQRWILGSTLLTKNMKVLVYGEWPGSSRNIKPFFTASYAESDKIPVTARSLEGALQFIFVGTLANGKRPLYAVKLVEKLIKSGRKARLALYGNGMQLENIRKYIADNNLGGFVTIEGNQPQDVIKQAYRESHFVILPSKSEGWPKVVAEGMFWGCLPITTSVSCVPFMLDHENRGILLEMDIDADVQKIMSVIENPGEYKRRVMESVSWSRNYTLDLFQMQIKELLGR